MSILRLSGRAMASSDGGMIPTLTTVFIGLAVLAVGLYLQARPVSREGFQAETAAVETTAPASATIELISPPAIAGAQLDAKLPEEDALKQKVAEIRTMLAAITANKPKQDLTLNGIVDAEILQTLNTLVDEVTFFDSKPPSPELELFLTQLNQFSNLTDEQKAKMRSMVLVGSQIASILYYIYVTLPTMIISTGIVADPKDTREDLLVDPTVVKEIRSTISSLLAGIPRLSTKLEEATKRLLSMMENFKDITRANPEYLEGLLIAYNDYYRLCNMKVQTYKRQISTQKIAVQSTFTQETMEQNQFLQKTGQNISLNIQAALDFIQMYLDTATPIQMKVDAALKEYPEVPDLMMLKTTLDANIQTMMLNKTSMTYTEKVMSPKKEGFVSVQNPYNSATPNLFQALKFRIGKETLITDVNASKLI